MMQPQMDMGAPVPSDPMDANAAMQSPQPAMEPQGGGLAGALGLSPDALRRAMVSLAGGLSTVKSGTTAGEAIAQSLGGSFGGANKFDDSQDKRRVEALDRAIKMQEGDRLQEYRKGTLGISQQNADTSRLNSESGNFNWLPGTGMDADGKPTSGMYRVNRKDGSQEFQPGASVGSRTGIGGGRESVFKEKLRVGEAIHGVGSKEAADYAAGNRKLSDGDIAKYADRGARSELNGDYQMQKNLKDPEARRQWIENRAREIATGVKDLSNSLSPQPAAPAAPAGTSPRSAAPGKVPEISFKGQGTQVAPYQPMSKDDYDQIETGTYYMDPSTGKTKIKGGGKVSDAGGADTLQGNSGDDTLEDGPPNNAMLRTRASINTGAARENADSNRRWDSYQDLKTRARMGRNPNEMLPDGTWPAR